MIGISKFAIFMAPKIAALSNLVTLPPTNKNKQNKSKNLFQFPFSTRRLILSDFPCFSNWFDSYQIFRCSLEVFKLRYKDESPSKVLKKWKQKNKLLIFWNFVNVNRQINPESDKSKEGHFGGLGSSSSDRSAIT